MLRFSEELTTLAWIPKSERATQLGTRLARNRRTHLFRGGIRQLLLRQPGRTGVQMNSAGGFSCSIGKVRSSAQRSVPENNTNETTGRPGPKAAAKATQRSNAGAAGICFLYL